MVVIMLCWTAVVALDEYDPPTMAIDVQEKDDAKFSASRDRIVRFPPFVNVPSFVEFEFPSFVELPFNIDVDMDAYSTYLRMRNVCTNFMNLKDIFGHGRYVGVFCAYV